MARDRWLVVGDDMMDQRGIVTTMSGKLADALAGQCTGVVHHTTLQRAMVFGTMLGQFQDCITRGRLTPVARPTKGSPPAPCVTVGADPSYKGPVPPPVDTPADLEALAATLVAVEDVFGDL